ncbi:MAG: PFL family protein [Oscillospiraceae bacterium]|jgi:uncharacterized protein (UPF0210 family)|nr:PFL family protein [Oscillospiraceae bacterium]
MLNTHDILETIKMISEENLDIRTVTMGISLLDCAGDDVSSVCGKIHAKISRSAEHLVSASAEIEKRYGIPIINKRISVTPISLLTAGLTKKDPILLAETLDRAAADTGVNFIGGYSALVHKGYAAGDKELIDSIPEALARTKRVCSSVNIGSTRAGINLDAAYHAAKVIKQAAILTKDDSFFGAAKIVVFCNAVEDNPFMAGAFHGIGEPDTVINVGVSGPGAVRAAVAKHPDATINELAEVIKKTAFKVTRMGQLVGGEVSRSLGVQFGIVDLSLAPTPAVGDSVARILETMGLSVCGCYGTTAALALLNDAVKKGGVMAAQNVGGLSGAFIPVSEDEGMIAAVRQGCLTLEKLEAMTAVCSVGLDMVAVPGDTSDEVIAAMLADEAAIGMINNKTTAVRVIPAIGMKAGDEINFGGLFGSAPIMNINTFSPEKFIQRGGRIPAPLQSLRN